jgi:CAAX prenyl protease-like protein
MPLNDSLAPAKQQLWQYCAPFGLFIVLQALPGLLRDGFASHLTQPAPFWLATPELWVYPLQTFACAAVLIWFRASYPRWVNLAGVAAGLLVGIVVFVAWISPQLIFHAAARVAGGFNPHQLPPGAAGSTLLYQAVVALRFARLVLVVPALEEIFWRGFLLRYLVREEFTEVPFGTFTPWSFGLVTLGFMLEHSTPDWPAALLAGALYNLVAIQTKSLPACILAHAGTNLLLGIYIMQTHQWGFW